MSSTAQEYLPWEFNEQTDQIVELIENLELTHTKGHPKTAEYNQHWYNLLGILNTLPVEFSGTIVRYLGYIKRHTVADSDNWTEFVERIFDDVDTYLARAPIEQVPSWLREATIQLITRRYGTAAALLYKLSDGASDPRKGGDA